MTFGLFKVWSNLCPSCCANTGRQLHGICKYEIAVSSGGRTVAHGPLVRCPYVHTSVTGSYLAEF